MDDVFFERYKNKEWYGRYNLNKLLININEEEYDEKFGNENFYEIFDRYNKVSFNTKIYEKIIKKICYRNNLKYVNYYVNNFEKIKDIKVLKERGEDRICVLILCLNYIYCNINNEIMTIYELKNQIKRNLDKKRKVYCKNLAKIIFNICNRLKIKNFMNNDFLPYMEKYIITIINKMKLLNSNAIDLKKTLQVQEKKLNAFDDIFEYINNFKDNSELILDKSDNLTTNLIENDDDTLIDHSIVSLERSIGKSAPESINNEYSDEFINKNDNKDILKKTLKVKNGDQYTHDNNDAISENIHANDYFFYNYIFSERADKNDEHSCDNDSGYSNTSEQLVVINKMGRKKKQIPNSKMKNKRNNENDKLKKVYNTTISNLSEDKKKQYPQILIEYLEKNFKPLSLYSCILYSFFIIWNKKENMDTNLYHNKSRWSGDNLHYFLCSSIIITFNIFNIKITDQFICFCLDVNQQTIITQKKEILEFFLLTFNEFLGFNLNKHRDVFFCLRIIFSNYLLLQMYLFYIIKNYELTNKRDFFLSLELLQIYIAKYFRNINKNFLNLSDIIIDYNFLFSSEYVYKDFHEIISQNYDLIHTKKLLKNVIKKRLSENEKKIFQEHSFNELYDIDLKNINMYMKKIFSYNIFSDHRLKTNFGKHGENNQCMDQKKNDNINENSSKQFENSVRKNNNDSSVYGSNTNNADKANYSENYTILCKDREILSSYDNIRAGNYCKDNKEKEFIIFRHNSSILYNSNKNNNEDSDTYDKETEKINNEENNYENYYENDKVNTAWENKVDSWNTTINNNDGKYLENEMIIKPSIIKIEEENNLTSVENLDDVFIKYEMKSSNNKLANFIIENSSNLKKNERFIDFFNYIHVLKKINLSTINETNFEIMHYYNIKIIVRFLFFNILKSIIYNCYCAEFFTPNKIHQSITNRKNLKNVSPLFKGQINNLNDQIKNKVANKIKDFKNKKHNFEKYLICEQAFYIKFFKNSKVFKEDIQKILEDNNIVLQNVKTLLYYSDNEEGENTNNGTQSNNYDNNYLNAPINLFEKLEGYVNNCNTIYDTTSHYENNIKNKKRRAHDIKNTNQNEKHQNDLIISDTYVPSKKKNNNKINKNSDNNRSKNKQKIKIHLSSLDIMNDNSKDSKKYNSTKNESFNLFEYIYNIKMMKEYKNLEILFGQNYFTELFNIFNNVNYSFGSKKKKLINMNSCLFHTYHIIGIKKISNIGYNFTFKSELNNIYSKVLKTKISNVLSIQDINYLFNKFFYFLFKYIKLHCCFSQTNGANLYFHQSDHDLSTICLCNTDRCCYKIKTIVLFENL
ncbi:conserved Plasmodium protein, unknown function [Plasmodium berghei]|uniref:Uncharacterized protein n=2 Tax=Plasmodium berghei TaxID=5821 RepID=A0A509ATW7_PLABA|nr:conserved Plasmodium protein, unknown function [Plasmodium berghei ANKA]SCM24802.1 conserved Plasmodium protein, unknown function [Plasmodium berghei]SCN27173.1 conserved Plasmodium protein, unknown function [Plasmodium berghei]SCO61719.1 conserved Plasmodium protein, unknown function [Plasmodium berghei]SCO63596.1 conserved Plasmodium protein, unknown function [Plasmodium berghei]VUC57028.1 conserved Plasmodium protein, unknown function [Plasmodium berghei ANKA]|eukprot:XP_034422807.1 conserved Plasmodium protein, unknown function [Plasmodium berghei ANKA]